MIHWHPDDSGTKAILNRISTSGDGRVEYVMEREALEGVSVQKQLVIRPRVSRQQIAHKLRRARSQLRREVAELQAEYGP